MPRILSIWLPQLPLDRLVRQDDARLTGPFAITHEERNTWRVAHPNVAALMAGVGAGQPLADARAICPDLLTEPSEPLRESLLLRALWRWADCLSPRVALDAPDGLLLDITGCAHLFGGEAQMSTYALTRLGDLSMTSQIGIADTKGAARALARFSRQNSEIAEPGNTGAALKHLPIAALGLPEQTISDLARSGLTTIAQLYEIKSSELARRYGLELIKSLSAATGQTPDPVTPKAADPVYAARMTLPEPVGLVSDVEGVLERLANAVCARLERDQKGARQFQLIVRSVNAGDHPFQIGFASPCFQPAPVVRQFSYPLSKLKLEFGADWFRLAASHVESIRLRQSTMEEDTKHADQRTRLIETLGNRIGFDHVRVFVPRESHLPEYEFEQVEAVQAGATSWSAPPRARPVRLFNPPEYVRVGIAGRPPVSFNWRGLVFTAEHAEGPERLTPRWHVDKDLRTRDYWKVQTIEGRRLWLLTYPASPVQDWYVAGEFP